MTQLYLVTEGKFEAKLLERLLPDDLLMGTKFVVGSGSYSALSLARSILAVKRRPVVLVLNADTTNESAVRERIELVHSLLHEAAVDVRFEVFIAVLSIEIVLFQDGTLLEQITHQEISEIEWNIARFQPKKVLTDLLQKHSQHLTAETMISGLNSDDVKILRKHPLLQQLIEFLSQEVIPI
jgi:hypothetical protein